MSGHYEYRANERQARYEEVWVPHDGTSEVVIAWVTFDYAWSKYRKPDRILRFLRQFGIPLSPDY